MDKKNKSQHNSNNEIAIVGLAFRLPGDLKDLDILWDALVNEQDLVSDLKDSRWDINKYYHSRKSEKGKYYSSASGLISDVDKFDAKFFGISPREARQMDPRQRLLLELTWEALENGEQIPASLRGSRCGVFVGISGNEYSMAHSQDPSVIDPYTMTGNACSIGANRISYAYDFRGPSMSIDTACSSALVALHQACKSIECGESSQAIAACAGINLHPLAYVGFSKAKMMSPDGRCKAFDEDANGYVRSEGAVVLYLKDLKQAQKDGDPIHAVIVGSGINSDGKTSSLPVPSTEAQAKLLTETAEKAGIEPEHYAYMEAHGTGTAVGDPIEVNAISQAIASHRKKPLTIGSVKSNVGHLEVSSGMAGLLKVVGCLKHKLVPPTIHCKKLNSNIDFDDLNISVATQPILFKDVDEPLIMGINCFGFGGTNSHVILREPPERKRIKPAKVSSSCPPLVLSTKNPKASKALAEQYIELITGKTSEEYYQLAWSTYLTRQKFEQVEVFSGESTDDILLALKSFVQDESEIPGLHRCRYLGAKQPVAFVFSGNGSQWFGMGKVLLNTMPTFRKAIEKVAGLFAKKGISSISEIILQTENEDIYSDTAIAQPSLFAIQVALIDCYKQQGIKPDYVIGHSVGEVAAAYCCGALSLQQAVQIVYARSQQQATTIGQGGMAALALSEDETIQLIKEHQISDRIEIAGVNSANAVTISGEQDAIDIIIATCEQRSVYAQRLPINYPFHSKSMKPLENAFRDMLGDISPKSTEIKFISTVHGQLVDGATLGSDYWWSNVLEPVKFADGIAELINLQASIFIEIGPHAVLQSYIQEMVRKERANAIVKGSLRRKEESIESITQTSLSVWIAGAECDVSHWFPSKVDTVAVPLYPWQKEHFWLKLTAESHDPVSKRSQHPLLGWRVLDDEPVWENHIDPFTHPILIDHQVDNSVVFPATGFLEMCNAALSLNDDESHEIIGLDILAPMVFDEDSTRLVRTEIQDGERCCYVKSRSRLSEEGWVTHAKCSYLKASQSAVTRQNIGTLKAPCTEHLSKDSHYQYAKLVGLNYGPAFQGLVDIHIGKNTVFSEVECPASIFNGQDAYGMHPALVDICFQSIIGLIAQYSDQTVKGGFLPVRMERVRCLGSLTTFSYIHAKVVSYSRRSILADFMLLDSRGEVLAILSGCRFRRVTLRHQEHTPKFYQYHACLDQANQHINFLNIEKLATTSELIKKQYKNRNKVYFETVSPLLDSLVCRYIIDAIKPMLEDTIASFTSLCQANNIASEQFGLFQRCLNILEEDGYISIDNNGHYCWLARDRDLPDADMIWLAILGDHPSYISELTVIGRSGSHLTELLQGQLKPKDIMMTGERSGVREHLLTSAPTIVNKYELVVCALIELLNSAPQNRNINILQYGVGEGGFVHALFSKIDSGLNINLTLVDEDELLLAKAVLHEGDGYSLNTLKYSLENSLDEQGILGTKQFDIIIIPEGLQQFDNIDIALSNIKKHLSLDGVLMLPEVLPERRHDLINGIYNEWWIHYDSGKAVSRLRTIDFWHKKLRESGFIFDQPICESGSDINEGCFLFLCQSIEATQDETTRPSLTCAVIYEEPKLFSQLCEANGDWQYIGIPYGYDDNDVPERLEEKAGQVCSDIQSNSKVDKLVIMLSNTQSTGAIEMLQWPVLLNKIAQSYLNNSLQSLVDSEIVIVTQGACIQDVTGQFPEQPCSAISKAVWGYVRVMMNELSDLAFKLVDCQLQEPELYGALISKELAMNDGEDEVILSDQSRWLLRLKTEELDALPPMKTQALCLDFEEAGPLKNLKWYPVETPSLEKDEILVKPKATGLNFRDVMYAMRLISDEAVENGYLGASLGMEFAGEVVAIGDQVNHLAVGDKVMGFAPASLSTLTKTNAGAVARLPLGWSYEDAATIPTAFFTAYYAIEQLAQAASGETILIHGAAGGVGIAAIQIAHFLELNIIATAGTNEKRDIIKKLGVTHVFDSRSNAFADDVMSVTNGRGVDIVLNSLAGEAIDLNLGILKPFGRFLELGKRDFFENSKIGLRPFRNNISYFGIDADQLMIERPKLTSKLFNKVISLFEESVLRPLPYRVFSANKVADAFRYMQQSKQIGKIIISFENEPQQTSPAVLKQSGVELSKKGRYVVTGGLSGFGLSTAEWLIEQGIQDLVLISRSGTVADKDKERFELLVEKATRVEPMAVDVTDKTVLFDALDSLEGKVTGIFHCAAVFDDAYLKDMTTDKLCRVLYPKALGGLYLDQWTRNHSSVKHFVVYSSGTSYLGNPGQSNYVSANAFLEGLVKQRQQQGLPGHYIAWGAMDDVGFLSRNTEVRDMMSHGLGLVMSSSHDLLEKMPFILEEDQVGAALMEFNISSMLNLLPSLSKPKFSALERDDHAADDANGADDVKAILQGKTLTEAEGIVTEILQEEIAEILCLPKENIITNQPITSLGIDSLMGVELVRAVEQRFGVTIPMMSLSQGPSVKKISRQVASQILSNEKMVHDNQASEEDIVSHVKVAAAQHAQSLTDAQFEQVVERINIEKSSSSQKDSEIA